MKCVVCVLLALLLTMTAMAFTTVFFGCGTVDPSTLQSCGDHCEVFPASMVSDNLRSALRETSPGFLCVPDRDIAYGGYYAVPCTAIFNLEGRCLGTCIPEVMKSAALLGKDVCLAGEVCVPCTNPFNMSSTGACTIAGDHPRK